MLSPGKVYYGHNTDIYVIDSTLVAKYTWNRYNVTTQHTWNRYNTNVQTAYRLYDVDGVEEESEEFLTIFNGVAEYNRNSTNYEVYYDEPANCSAYVSDYNTNAYREGNQYNFTDLVNGIVLDKYNRRLHFSMDWRDGSLAGSLIIERLETSSESVIFGDFSHLLYYEMYRSNGDDRVRLTFSGTHVDEDFQCKIEVLCDKNEIKLTTKNTYEIVYGSYTDNSYIDDHTKLCKRSSSDDKYSQGTYIDQVHNTSYSAYPQNGRSGSYWYVYQDQSDTRGAFIDTVTSIDANQYPDNGILDGYWYVKQ